MEKEVNKPFVTEKGMIFTVMDVCEEILDLEL